MHGIAGTWDAQSGWEDFAGKICDPSRNAAGIEKPKA